MAPPTKRQEKPPKGSEAEFAAEPTQSLGRPHDGEELRLVASRPDDLQRAISLLDELVEAFGGSRRQVDPSFGAGRSQTSQVLSGHQELQLQHLLDVLDVLGIETRAFFEVLYSEEEHAPFPAPLAGVARQKLRAMGAPAGLPPLGETPSEASPSTRFLTEEEIRRLIDHRLFEAYSRVSLSDLTDSE